MFELMLVERYDVVPLLDLDITVQAQENLDVRSLRHLPVHNW